MTQKTKSTSSLTSIVGIIVGVAVMALVKQFVFKSPSFDKALMNTASEINKTCPMMVDQETQLDNTISLPNKVFQYNYTLVNINKDSIDLNVFEDYLKPAILQNIKTNPDLKSFRENKVTMAYYYKDKNGEFITKILVTPDQYTNEESAVL